MKRIKKQLRKRSNKRLLFNFSRASLKEKKRTNNSHSGNLKKADKVLFVLTIILTLSGLVAIANASAPWALKEYNDQLYLFKHQAYWAILGIAVMLVVANINYKFWEKHARYAIVFIVALLVAVLLPGIGIQVSGARRWLELGFLSFQPSEVVKLLICIYFAKLATTNKRMVAFFIPLVVATGLIMLQPDLGTTIVVAIIGLTQIFVSGISIAGFAASLGVGFMLSLILVLFSDYRRDRLLTFFEQTQDPLGKAYHIRQVLFALGSGGLFGVGLGQSRQKHFFLPETATDSIFAVIAEEIGFVGSILLIVVFVYYIYRIIRISLLCPDSFSRVFVVGIAAWIGGQTFLNLGSMVALVPLTGIPLPFFSYGGTSLVSILAGVGIVLNISKHEKRAK